MGQITVYQNNTRLLATQKGIKNPSQLHFEARIAMGTARRYWKSKYIPSGVPFGTLVDISNALGVSVHDLIGESVKIDESDAESEIETVVTGERVSIGPDQSKAKTPDKEAAHGNP